ncbi:MAG: hypothetical protein KDJ25_16405, partial [Rhodoblastus sp.]|nr:hypothetical protein [Rhodoblastus sp.]
LGGLRGGQGWRGDEPHRRLQEPTRLSRLRRTGGIRPATVYVADGDFNEDRRRKGAAMPALIPVRPAVRCSCRSTPGQIAANEIGVLFSRHCRRREIFRDPMTR